MLSFMNMDVVGFLFNRNPASTTKPNLYHTYQGTKWEREINYSIGISMGNIWEKSKGCI